MVAIWEGRIAAVGRRAAVEGALEADGPRSPDLHGIDAAGGAVTPALIHPHTHRPFAGSREDELVTAPAAASDLHPRRWWRDPVHGRDACRGRADLAVDGRQQDDCSKKKKKKKRLLQTN